MPAPRTDPGAEDPIQSGSQKEPLAPLAAAQPLAPGGHAPEFQIESVQQSPHWRWYRTGEAALFLGVSTKSVLRWTASGFLRCERAGYWAHRYYAVEELVRVQRKLKT
jgi:hypothetical protein